jgi:L-galactose dehydrogenase
MQYRILGNTGVPVSVLGFGASPLGDVFCTIDPKEGENAVHLAIDRGVNLFDVSPYYGRTLAEERLGAALSGRRKEVFLATKCGRYETHSFDFSPRRIERSIDESLTRLRTDYVDLLLAHDVEFGDLRQIIDETVPALRRIQESGKARWIGITGYPLQALITIAREAAVDVILSYCRYNLMITDMDNSLTPFVQERGIGLINASPLHMGILTDDGAPSWHPAPQAVKDAGARVVQLCRSYGADPSVLALRFCLDHPYAASTLVGMSDSKQVEDNLRAIDTVLDPVLMEQIRQIVKPVNNRVWASGRPENADLTT